MEKSTKQNIEPTPLQAFRLRHKLSYQQLSDVCEKTKDCSKGSIERLLKNESNSTEIEAHIRKVLALKLPKFLLNRGLNASHIDAELSAIFNKGEYQPMIDKRYKLNKSAQQHFGLNRDPFELLPKSRSEVFVGKDLDAVFSTVKDAIVTRQFIVITGEIGSGKTILKMLIEDYAANSPSVSIISPQTFDMSKITASAITREMLEALGENTIPRSPVAQKKRLQEICNRKSNLHITLLFDEAHDMYSKTNKETIPSLKNFYEMLRHGFSQNLGIILIGQPPLKTLLNSMPEMQQRLPIIDMPDFKNSAIEYLAHRLKIAGIDDISTLFDDEALEIIKINSDTPLRLGNVVNKAFQVCKDCAETSVFGSLLTAENSFAQEPEEAKVLSMKKKAG
jgi:type II secretory pathway predicted ATPase ExeA